MLQVVRKYAGAITLFFLFLSYGCEKKLPVEPLPTPPIDIIGFEQTVRVGNYVVLEDTCNGVLDGEPIIWYEWSQDSTNPVEVFLMSDYYMSSRPIGFVKEGIYRFTLVVSTQTKNDTTGRWQVTVLPREESVFEDPKLEVKVRYTLKIATKTLTQTDFLSLDTLMMNCIITDRITSLSGIENCSNLLFLGMPLQRIKDLTPLTNLTKMIRLDLDQNWGITDVTPLTGMMELQHLNLDGNYITDISCLSNLTKLTYFNVRYNSVSDISVVANMPDLEELWLGPNPISDISALADLKKLTTLWLTNCNISDISSLQNSTNLELIKLAVNQVTDISALAGMTKLERAYLEQNRIEDISALEFCVSLNILRLADNNVVDILPLVNNTGLGRGDLVSLDNNPLNDKSTNEYIPTLRARGVAVSWW
ncbi:MAG: hypothetical protein DRP89_02130 [Candidatus Neomarinimicrobiota bacterium]|nr:MAG: hypothetical protein DRP89_02130 [Candidatus Neomarinimicrobiota bacterium]